MERPFDIQIEKLRTKIIKMCSIVDEQVGLSINSILNYDKSLADLVIEIEEKVDRFDVKIERICQKLFALNQPVAMDLRLIMSALKINSSLERMGDLAVNIARNSKDLKNPPGFMQRLNFEEIARIAREMIKKSFDSFINSDAELAKSVISSDNQLDEFVKVNSKILIEIMKEKAENIENALIIHSVLQEIERLGDHAVNISEEVYFIIKAQSLKHRGDLDIEDSWNIE
ncbi:MAG: phosphate transport system regulatory protein PhoU [Ignavibacteria bacterium GWB2_35_6b]|nr:MAG: phosphate transport system regulatory protein PhoU [Ignavibacteria bacterium GWB2_35_6b]